jgi:hypothetical protein
MKNPKEICMVPENFPYLDGRAKYSFLPPMRGRIKGGGFRSFHSPFIRLQEIIELKFYAFCMI